MSSVYTMKLVVDDSAVKKLEDRLNKIMGFGTSSSGSSGGGAKTGASPFANLGKLGAIAAGITALVIAVQKIVEKVVDASPALQAMLKLLDASITLILRPFGDFIAFFLKPILIMFLTRVALPFYKLTAPMARFFGESAGNFAANNLSSNLGGLGDILTGDLESLDARFNDIRGWWLNTAEWFKGLEFPDVSGIWQGITDWWDSIAIPDWLNDTWQNILGWWQSLQVSEWMNNIWNVVTQFFASLIIPPWLMTIWYGVSNFFSTLTIPEWMVNIWYGVTQFFATLQIPQWVTDIISGFFDFIKKIGDWLASIPSWISNALGLNKTGGGGTTPEPAKKAELNVNLSGIIEGAGQMTEGLKQQILGLFNEWMK